jgi:biopolymer transport protein TolQ
MQERIFSIAHYADQAVLYLLILLSLVSIVMIFERYGKLKRISKSSNLIRVKMETGIEDRNLEVIKEIDRETVEGRALSYALDHLEKNGIEGLDEMFETISKVERPKLEKSLGFLATVGANAPYIGLFGTVLGIMKAFQDLGKAADVGQQTVMTGISSALVATAAGLMVAIPAVLAYNYFQRLVKGTLSNLESIKFMVIAYAKSKGEGFYGRKN